MSCRIVSENPRGSGACAYGHARPYRRTHRCDSCDDGTGSSVTPVVVTVLDPPAGSGSGYTRFALRSNGMGLERDSGAQPVRKLSVRHCLVPVKTGQQH